MENPRQGKVTAAATREHTASTCDKEKENRERASNYGQSKQPASHELPCRQSEQKEIQGLAENRVDHATRGRRHVQKKRDRRPLRHHPGAGCKGDSQRNAHRDEPQDGLDRQSHWLLADEYRVAAWQIREMRSLQGQE